MSELREKIAAKIAPHMRLTSFNPDCETQERNKQYALEVADSVIALIQKEQEWRDIAQQAERLIWNYAIANIPTEPEREAARELCEQLRGPTPPQEQGS